MADLFSSGAVVAGILVLMLGETVALLVIRRVTRRGPAPLEVLVSLGAGAALMLALRAALVGSGWPAVAGWLLAALAAHLADLACRFRLPSGP